MIRTRQYVLALGDFTMLFLGLFVMILIRFDYTHDPSIVNEHFHVFFPLFIVWILVFYIFDLYDVRSTNPNPRTIGKIALAIITATIVSGFFFYIQRGVGINPKTNLLITSATAFILLVLWRRLFYTLFASIFSRKIMLVGTSAELTQLQNHFKEQVPLGRIVLSLHTVSQLYDMQHIPHVDLVITDSVSANDIVMLEKKIDAQVLTLVDAYSELFAKIPLSLMTDEHALRIATKNRNYSYTFVTRIFEIVVSAIALIVFSPFIIIAGLAKKIEDGGDIFLKHHARVGKNGKPFYLKKIRSMISDADKAGNQWAQKSDTRITRVGSIIRKLHIDEIPQLWNVIRGDMALVGPRPEQPEFVATLEKEIPYYYLRHIIKPGFTGWAQIKFRYARTVEDSKQKLEYDLYYLENRSPLLDLGIIAKTIQIIFTH